MKTKDIKVCIIRTGGISCDTETARAFQEFNVQTEIKHINEIVKLGNLLDYNLLVFPGGSSFGNYIRSGAILAKTLNLKLGKQIKQYIDKNRPILGISNGFQTLIEYGLLPGFENSSTLQSQLQVTLAPNIPQGFKCKWVYLRNDNRGKCLFTDQIPQNKILRIPIAHDEGRLLFLPGKEKSLVEELIDNDMLVFRYCHENGAPADQVYPTNPNGAYYDIAGICNNDGTIFGLMPHPGRAMYWWQEPDWTSKTHTTPCGDGRLIFESIINNITQKQ